MHAHKPLLALAALLLTACAQPPIYTTHPFTTDTPTPSGKQAAATPLPTAPPIPIPPSAPANVPPTPLGASGIPSVTVALDGAGSGRADITASDSCTFQHIAGRISSPTLWLDGRPVQTAYVSVYITRTPNAEVDLTVDGVVHRFSGRVAVQPADVPIHDPMLLLDNAEAIFVSGPDRMGVAFSVECFDRNAG